MSDDPQQDADLTQAVEPPQESAGSPDPEIPASFKTRAPALPIYANPSFYTTPQVSPASPSTSEADSASFVPPSRSRQDGHTYDSASPPPPRLNWRKRQAEWRRMRVEWRKGQPPLVSPFWRMVRQFPLQYWRILSRPGMATFDRELWKADWGAVWTQLLGLILLNILLAFIFLFGMSLLVGSSIGTYSILDFMRGFLSIGIVLTVPLTIGTLMGFFFDTIIYCAFAWLLGGRGSYLEHCYGTVLIMIPMEIITLIVSFGLVWLPQFPGKEMVPLAFLFFGLLLQIFMTMAAHRLSVIGATIAVLVPAFVLGGGLFWFAGGHLFSFFGVHLFKLF